MLVALMIKLLDLEIQQMILKLYLKSKQLQ